MQAFEFQANIKPDHTLSVPTEIAKQIQKELPVHVIVLIPDATEDQEWSQLTAEQFLKGYVEGDAVYDELPTW